MLLKRVLGVDRMHQILRSEAVELNALRRGRRETAADPLWNYEKGTLPDDSSFALGMKFIAEEAAERARARMLRLFGTSDASAFFCSELYSQPPAGFSVQGGQREWL